jgi:hypothetical protein
MDVVNNPPHYQGEIECNRLHQIKYVAYRVLRILQRKRAKIRLEI